jgi:hypothetical protein
MWDMLDSHFLVKYGTGRWPSDRPILLETLPFYSAFYYLYVRCNYELDIRQSPEIHMRIYHTLYYLSYLCHHEPYS